MTALFSLLLTLLLLLLSARQAFLPHFSHAVPSTVLRDLRRAFHRNEGDETRMVSSPPPSTSRAARASPETVPTPSPSPMRLRAPDMCMPSPLHNCVWMGRDRGLCGLVDEGGEAMVREGARDVVPRGIWVDGWCCVCLFVATVLCKFFFFFFVAVLCPSVLRF